MRIGKTITKKQKHKHGFCNKKHGTPTLRNPNHYTDASVRRPQHSSDLAGALYTTSDLYTAGYCFLRLPFCTSQPPLTSLRASQPLNISPLQTEACSFPPPYIHCLPPLLFPYRQEPPPVGVNYVEGLPPLHFASACTGKSENHSVLGSEVPASTVLGPCEDCRGDLHFSWEPVEQTLALFFA
ncbi:hypothetical protein KSP40_PGU005428 [Platanthera guangdongensis]|uniref:Uncharacterized protein n=1 Tax=Platanthera guangdongensis TaxID=2320717 RepID=A0ABR2LVF2_9ASPA